MQKFLTVVILIACLLNVFGLDVINTNIPITVAKTIYIAPRTDGKEGAGTFNDPWDASNPEKLYVAWRKFIVGPDWTQPNRKIIFMPGVYVTTNILQLWYNNNATISGYGATIFYQGTNMVGQKGVLSSFWYGNENIVIEGFELDCGSYSHFAGDGKVCGIWLKGKNNIIRNNVIRNIVSANFTNNVNEAFGIILESTNGICSGNLVDGLTVPSGRGGGTAVVIQGQGNTCLGNTVCLNDYNPTNGFYSFAYSCYGSENTFVGNTCRGVDMAFSMDAAGNGEFDGQIWRDNIILGNQFSSTQLTLRIHPNTQGYADWAFIGNNFKTENEWVELYYHSAYYMSNGINGFSFIGNRFTGKPRPTINMAFNMFKTHSFIANTFSVAPNVAFGTNVNTLYGFGNTLNGKPYNGWLGVVSPVSEIISPVLSPITGTNKP